MSSAEPHATSASEPLRNRSPWRASVTDLISAVSSGDRLGVSGFHFTRAPIALLHELVRSDKRDLHYLSWGGGFPLEVLLAGDSVGEISFCFSSLEVFGLAPRFRAALENGAIPFNERTALTHMSELRAAAENLDHEVMQAPQGSDLIGDLDPVASAVAPMVAVPAGPLDVFLLHAQRADDDGNVEIQGARGLDMSSVFAAKTVLVTVEERVRPGQLGAARSFILPRSHVTAIAEAPGGAYPTACLPYYSADLGAIGDAVEAGTDEALFASLRPTPTNLERARTRGAVSTLPRATVGETLVTAAREYLGETADVGALHSESGHDATIPELMISLIADTVTNESVCSFGSAALVPAAAYLLAKNTHAPDALIMSSNGGYVDLAPRPMMLSLAETADFASAAAHTGGDETYRWYYQAGRITHEVVGSAQVDERAATNNLWITRADGSRIRLPGQGGMADVANLHRDFVIYLPRQSDRNLVASLEAVSASRAWLDDETRRAYGLVPGVVRIITDLAVFVLDHDTRRLRTESIHPTSTAGQVRAAMGFDPAGLDDAPHTAQPSPSTLAALRTTVDPLNIARLEFLPARERSGLIRDILTAEDSMAARIAHPRTAPHHQGAHS